MYAQKTIRNRHSHYRRTDYPGVVLIGVGMPRQRQQSRCTFFYTLIFLAISSAVPR
jgi:hypothetical protein